MTRPVAKLDHLRLVYTYPFHSLIQPYTKFIVNSYTRVVKG